MLTVSQLSGREPSYGADGKNHLRRRRRRRRRRRPTTYIFLHVRHKYTRDYRQNQLMSDV